jgi:hypothetical protein
MSALGGSQGPGTQYEAADLHNTCTACAHTIQAIKHVIIHSVVWADSFSTCCTCTSLSPNNTAPSFDLQELIRRKRPTIPCIETNKPVSSTHAWNPALRFYHLLLTTTCSASIMLTIFYW